MGNFLNNVRTKQARETMVKALVEATSESGENMDLLRINLILRHWLVTPKPETPNFAASEIFLLPRSRRFQASKILPAKMPLFSLRKMMLFCGENTAVSNGVLFANDVYCVFQWSFGINEEVLNGKVHIKLLFGEGLAAVDVTVCGVVCAEGRNVDVACVNEFF